MDLNKEFFACLALKHIPRLGPQVWKQLFSHFTTAYDALNNYDSWVDLGVKSYWIKSLVKHCRTESWREKAESEFRAAHAAKMTVLTWFDPRFPNSLKQLEDPPALLYVSGDISLLKNPGVAVVGARECTSLGLTAARRISAQLAQVGITVVSGLALGIDRQAHLGGLSGLGSSIAVLGCGIDVDYPQDNRDIRQELLKRGLVVSEFGPGVTPRPGHFPFRNRLISCLSLGVLVAEAAHASGSLITARLAAEQGREVFALPGPLGSPTFTGCHRLIKQGAALVENAEDIVEILRYDFAKQLEMIPDPDSLQQIETSDDALLSEPNLSRQFEGALQSEEVENNHVDTALDDIHADKPKNDSEQRRRRFADRKSILLSEDEERVMDLLYAEDKKHIDSLGRELQWSSAKMSKILIMLEMRGAVKQLPGMWYLAKES